MNVRCFTLLCVVISYFGSTAADARAQDFFQALGQALGGGGGNWGGGNRGGGGNWFNVTPRYEERLTPRYKDVWRTQQSSGNGYDSASRYRERVFDGYDRTRVQSGVNVTPNIGAIVKSVDDLTTSSLPPNRTWGPDSNYRQPQYTYPQNTYPRQNTIPQNATRSAPKTAAPKNVLARKVDPPKNDASLALTDVQKDAAEDTAEEADKLADAAEDQLLNDPALTDPAQAEKVKDAVKKFKETGDASDLDAIKNDGTMPASVKDKIDIFVGAHEAGELIRDGGLNTKGTDRVINDLEDKITSSNNLSTAEKITLQREIGAMRESNDNRKTIDAIVAAGSGGGSGGGPGGGIVLDGIDLTSLNPNGPIFTEDPVEDAENAAASSGTLLVNPEENGASISYVLANHQYTMQPGQSQRIDREYTIEFHRGGDFGNARYSLPAGTYEFTLTDGGWDLRKKTYAATIDNSRYPGAFGYVVKNKQYTLQPGEKKTHTDAYPLAVVFDRGDGGEPARKQLSSGTYQVGLDAEEGRLDLFPDEGGSLLSVN
jgi:hypothetical protein